MREQKLTFVTGKGGVGKSTVATALALKYAARGESTLLVELGEVQYLSKLFNITGGIKPQNVEPNLDVAQFAGEECLRDFIKHYIKVDRVVNLFFQNRVMSALVRAAPALSELSLLGKITSGIRGIGPKLNYKNIVIDAFSTGHFVALFQVPRGFSKAVQFGPMGEQSRDMDRVLCDSSTTEIVTVTIPEEMPTVETIELQNSLKQHFQMESQVVLNKVMQLPELPIVEDEFIRYLEKKKKDQEAAEHQLQLANLKFHRLPYYFLSTQKLLRSMSRELS